MNYNDTLPGMICAADYYHFRDLSDGGLQFFPMCLKVTQLGVTNNTSQLHREWNGLTIKNTDTSLATD